MKTIITKIFLGSALGIMAAVGGYLVFARFHTNEIFAGSGENTKGFAWSSNIGWMSFNSVDCDVDGDGTFEGASEGGGSTPAPIACPSSGSAGSYGVNIDGGTGKLSGTAWSPSVGWISFDRGVTNDPPDSLESPDVCDTSSDCIAKYDSATVTGEISGWARALSACKDDLWDGTRCTGSGAGDIAGGWDGWISLRGSAPAYGVRIDFAEKALRGWAWGGDVVGWVAMSCADINAVPGLVCEDNFEVIADVNSAPVAEIGECLIGGLPASCSVYEKEVIQFTNDSSDPDGIEDIEDSFWNILAFGGGTDYTCSGVCPWSFQPSTISLDAGDYEMELVVIDSVDHESAPSAKVNFQVKQDASADFECSLDPLVGWTQSCSTLNVAEGQKVHFRDGGHSNPSDGASLNDWDWIFSDGTPSLVNNDSGDADAIDVTFNGTGSKLVTLTVRDNGGRIASVDKNILINVSLPDFIEVNPSE